MVASGGEEGYGYNVAFALSYAAGKYSVRNLSAHAGSESEEEENRPMQVIGARLDSKLNQP